MKTKAELQKIIVALVFMLYRPDNENDLTDSEKRAARRALDVVLWAAGYPNNFKTFCETAIKACQVTDEQLEQVFKESLEAYLQKRGMGADSFTE